MRLRQVVAAVALVVAAACSSGTSGPVEGALPASDHVHALRTTDDGGLLLGLHGALWRSDDGTSWEVAGLEGQDAMALGVAQPGEPLLVGGHDVLARSTDDGATFEPLSPQLPSLDIHALAQAPSAPQTVYAFVVGAGLHVSTDAGDSWEPLARVDREIPGDLGAMAVDLEDPDIVLVGSPSLGVLRSADGGASFEAVHAAPTASLASGAGGTVVAVTGQGVDVSDDGGVTWRNVAAASAFEGQPLATALGPEGETLWLVTEEPRVLLRSQDLGQTWDEVARA